LDHFNFDADYLVRVRGRDPVTLAHFCDFFYLPIRNHVKHKLPRGPVEDIVQDVFMAALRRIDAGAPEDPCKLPGYLFGISNHLISRSINSAGRQNVVDIDPTLFADARDRADVQVIKGLNKSLVQRVVKKLSSRDRDAITRVFFLQEERAAAAREMNVSQERLRTILCRALKRFRMEWDNIQGAGHSKKTLSALEKNLNL
jgi:RNA polymerase sigma factor (sigma-70 family)